MQLIQPMEDHLIEMMSWSSKEQDLIDWAGPNFRCPFNLFSFAEDLKLNQLSSFALLTDESEFLAFGQFYQRLSRCHLCRLIVSPKCRGKGIASKLMSHLCALGLKELKVKDCSLFVAAHNHSAIRSYKKFGFSFADYPGEIPFGDCLYMVKS